MYGYVCMVSIHKELESKAKKLKRMKKEFMQRTIKTESTWGVVVVINQYSLWLWRIRRDGMGEQGGRGWGSPFLLLIRVEAY